MCVVVLSSADSKECSLEEMPKKLLYVWNVPLAGLLAEPSVPPFQSVYLPLSHAHQFMSSVVSSSRKAQTCVLRLWGCLTLVGSRPPKKVAALSYQF